MINEHPSVQALLERNARKTGPPPRPACFSGGYQHIPASLTFHAPKFA
jgi:hypothetical protein